MWHIGSFSKSVFATVPWHQLTRKLERKQTQKLLKNSFKFQNINLLKNRTVFFWIERLRELSQVFVLRETLFAQTFELLFFVKVFEILINHQKWFLNTKKIIQILGLFVNNTVLA